MRSTAGCCVRARRATRARGSVPYAPQPPRYHHDTNAHAHLRASLSGPSETSILAVGGELGVGAWQQVVLVDFDDRPWERVVSVQVLS